MKNEFILFSFHSFCATRVLHQFLGLHKSVAAHRKTSMWLQTIYDMLKCFVCSVNHLALTSCRE